MFENLVFENSLCTWSQSWNWGLLVFGLTFAIVRQAAATPLPSEDPQRTSEVPGCPPITLCEAPSPPEPSPPISSTAIDLQDPFFSLSPALSDLPPGELAPPVTSSPAPPQSYAPASATNLSPPASVESSPAPAVAASQSPSLNPLINPLEPFPFLAQEAEGIPAPGGTEEGTGAIIEESPENDPELGIIRVRSAVEDPELGIIRIQQIPEVPVATETEQPPPPVAFLTGRISAVSSGNIFLSIDPILGLVGDEFIRPGISLLFYPPVSPSTRLLISTDINFQRYASFNAADYDEVRFRLGVNHRFSPRTTGQLSWGYQQLFRPGLKNRFFENDSFELLLRRQDPITRELFLNTYYQLQLSYSNPDDFNRLIQFAGAYLGYQVTPQIQVGLNYQLTLADYIRLERYDAYQQILGQFVYQFAPSARVILFGGFTFGRSSEPSIRYDNTLFGISIEGTVTLF